MYTRTGNGQEAEIKYKDEESPIMKLPDSAITFTHCNYADLTSAPFQGLCMAISFILKTNI